MRIEGEKHWEIPADLHRVDDLCKDLRAWLVDQRLPGHIFAMQMLLSEAVNNAIIHGAHEDARMSVRCDLVRDGEQLRMTVSDDGPGFNWQTQMQMEVPDEEIHGRGVVIYRMFADEILFNDAGNCVTLTRRLDRQSR